MYLLLGYGKSNKSVAKYFQKEKIPYMIYDDNLENEDYHIEGLKEINMIVKTGGIPNEHKIILEAKEVGIEVVSDLELYYRLKTNDGKIIAITGTNGKSTTVSLLKHVIGDIDLGGNIGIPVFDYIESNKDIIIEVSSYMGEYLKNFKPNIGCILNIYPNHLKHHKTIDNYVLAKINIFKNMKENDFFVYNAEDTITKKYLSMIPCKKMAFSEEEILNREKLNPYLVNYLENVQSVFSIAKAYGLTSEVIQERVLTFSGLEHRIELFLEKNNIKYYNDSKSTNLYAMNKALNLFCHSNVLLVCGGKKKEEDYSLINCGENVVQVICCGENGYILQDEYCKRNILCCRYETLKEAIENLDKHMGHAEVVLFSFGSESFDQFDNFEARGKFIKDNCK